MVIDANNILIRVEEGSGDNLLPEDMENGYVDYVNYETYSPEERKTVLLMDAGEDACARELDGGMVLLEEFVTELQDTIPSILSEIFGNTNTSFQILNENEGEKNE